MALLADLKLMVNNPKFSDLKIKCGNWNEGDEILYASRLHLAARSEFFERMLFNGMRETTSNEITFPNLSTSALKLILEFLYTDSIEVKNLTASSAFDTFVAANFFLLPEIEKIVTQYVEIGLKAESAVDLALEFFTRAVEQDYSEDENELYLLVYRKVAETPLDTIPYNKMTGKILEKLLSETKNHIISEYDIFRYVILWGANQVSKESFAFYSQLLPVIDEIKIKELRFKELLRLEEENSNLHSTHKLVVQKVSSILPFIDFRLIPMKIFALIIDPLNILESDQVLNLYRYFAIIEGNRKIEWDPKIAPQNFKLTENFTVAETKSNESSLDKRLLGARSLRAKNSIKGTGFFDWTILIEEKDATLWIGVCGADADCSRFLGLQPNCWLIGSNGSYFNNCVVGRQFEVIFNKGDRVTIHLDIRQRTLAFSINEVRYPTIFTDLVSELYPAVCLTMNGRVRLCNNSQQRYSF
ncbi:hypothetical protein G9A89_001451 [Geosiphon pyriformis]|nr:hypothetical protein G9A89_001451 [Geosiphon pyriformis]